MPISDRSGAMAMSLGSSCRVVLLYLPVATATPLPNRWSGVPSACHSPEPDKEGNFRQPLHIVVALPRDTRCCGHYSIVVTSLSTFVARGTSWSWAARDGLH